MWGWIKGSRLGVEGGLKGVCNRILFHFDAEAPENVYNYGRPRVSRRL